MALLLVGVEGPRKRRYVSFGESLATVRVTSDRNRKSHCEQRRREIVMWFIKAYSWLERKRVRLAGKVRCEVGGRACCGGGGLFQRRAGRGRPAPTGKSPAAAAPSLLSGRLAATSGRRLYTLDAARVRGACL